ncbi:hypothetical protein HMPREF0063_11721 [Aeromicrobium marinum DSM 15272]|uniref:Fenitrothion hydrolase n=1 Tax=Aeromicrobium marinum DSM 15272 TaxID=585531 RepID=E2SDD5_9ACTN|nr:hypothetical protein [Aeromicrobium marinum]EFQ82512.1 hypothetical protein HMPREF0063_11721 [Aeromicrobium marinum DSM 15272]
MILPLHGLGGATDLPIPFTAAVIGASWALAISFGVLALAWKRPLLQSDLPAAEPPPRRRWSAALGLVLTGWLLLALYAGPADASNGALGGVYVLVWVGLVPLALLFGHVWRDLSPWRTAQAAVGRLTGRPDGWLPWPAGWGYWPAVVGLFAFVWLELASPDPGSVVAMRWWVGVYVVVMLVGGTAFGPRWFDRADPFDVYSAVVARLSPFVRDGRFALHNPLRSLPQVPVDHGLVAVLGVLLGSTAFDSFAASPFWQRRDVGDVGQTIVLLGFCAVAGLLFTGAARATGGLDRDRRRELPGLLAHSLVPIVVGYVFAHYVTYLVEKGQETLIALGDPLGRGWTPFGDLEPSYVLSSDPELLASLKVTFVVVGHVLAVVAAHDKALELLPRSHRLTGQLAMLVLMIAFTFTGLFLLFNV